MQGGGTVLPSGPIGGLFGNQGTPAAGGGLFQQSQSGGTQAPLMGNLFGGGAGLQPQQQLGGQQLLGVPQQQQPVQAGVAAVAAVAPPSAQQQAQQDQKLLQQFRDAQKKINTRDEELAILRRKLAELNGRVKNDFERGFRIAKSNDQMNRDVQQQLTLNLNKMGVSLNHINYVNDMLHALSNKVKTSQESRNNYSVQSLFKVGDLHCVTQQQLQQLHGNAVLNATSYQQHQLSNVHNKFLDELRGKRTNYRGSGSVPESRAEVFDAPKFDKQDQLIQGVFSKLEEYLFAYNRIRNEQGTISTAAQRNIIESIFDALMKSSAHLQKDFQLLKFQFHDYPLTSPPNPENRQLILDNTVRYLEHQFRVDAFDIYSLNRKFQTMYLPDMRNYQIKSLNGIYPSGVLLMLARMGRTDLGKRVFEGWAQGDHPLIKEVQNYLSYAERSTYYQSEVRAVYEGVLSSSKIDSIFKQLYLILFQISEIEDVFETVHFKQDRDLLLWLTLKTCNSGSHESRILADDSEPEQLYTTLTLDELKSSIPQQPGYMLDLQLQRYDKALRQMALRPEQVQQYPHELALLLIILKDTGLIDGSDYQNCVDTSRAITLLVTHLFPTQPLLASVIAQMGLLNPKLRSQQLELTKQLSLNFVRSKNVNKLFDTAFKQQITEHVFKKDATQLQDLQRLAVRDLLLEQLQLLLRNYTTALEAATTKANLFEALEELNQRIDELAYYLREIQQIQSSDQAIFELCYIATETLFVHLLCETMLYQQLKKKFNVQINDPDTLRTWKSLKYPEAKELYYFLRLLIQEIFNQRRLSEPVQRLYTYLKVIEVFAQVLQLLKRERTQPTDTILTVIENLQLPYHIVDFHLENKDSTVFNLLWIVREILVRNNAPTNRLRTIVLETRNQLRNHSKDDLPEMRRPFIMGQEVDVAVQQIRPTDLMLY